jgi:cytochrome c oxidase subunit 2
MKKVQSQSLKCLCLANSHGLSPFGITLAGQAGMNITYLAVIEVLAVAITIVGVGVVLWSTRHPTETDSHGLAKYERHWTIIVIVIFVAFSVSTLPFIPYPYVHANVKPDTIVHVQAHQFAWCLSNASFWGTNCATQYQISKGSTVQFEVNSSDTTHGFGVYDPSGAIIFQVQVMPGYLNNITYTFSTPGIYYIRCLEFCGYGHYAMYSSFNVTAT